MYNVGWYDTVRSLPILELDYVRSVPAHCCTKVRCLFGGEIPQLLSAEIFQGVPIMKNVREKFCKKILPYDFFYCGVSINNI